ncbi:MAG: hypothetical protein IIB30_07900 [Chloroflexi bacterium]|nr:hypothetical protein [Chloroflexota bacterium]
MGAVDDHVFFGKVTTPGDGVAVTQVKVQAESYLRAAHLCHHRVPREGQRLTRFHDTNAIHKKVDFLFDGSGPAAPQSHHHTSPVGVGAVYRRLDQVGGSDRAGGLASILYVSSTGNINYDQSGGALPVAGHLPGQVHAHLQQCLLERGGILGAGADGPVAGESIGQHQQGVVGAGVTINRQHVEHVQITVAETVGMEGHRGSYYDTAGALRDVVQNHMLQLLALTAMDPPATARR